MAKLVRDLRPHQIREEGNTPQYHVATKEEFWTYLVRKLGEETDEFLKSPNEAEFVDVLEVIDEIKRIMGTEQIDSMRDMKAAKLGTFSKKIILDDWE